MFDLCLEQIIKHFPGVHLCPPNPTVVRVLADLQKKKQKKKKTFCSNSDILSSAESLKMSRPPKAIHFLHLSKWCFHAS